MKIFETLIKESSDLFIVLEPDGKITFINNSSNKFIGLSPEKSIGENIFDYIHPEDKPICEEAFRNWKKKKLKSGVIESRLITKNNTVLYLLWSWNIFYSQSDQVEYIHAIGHDISEKKRIEEERDKALKYRSLNQKKMAQLLELNRDTAHLSEKELCDRSLDIAVDITNSQVGYLHIVNNDQSTISLVSWNKEALKHCNAEYDNHYPIEKAGIWADCARYRKTIIHNDYKSEKNKKGLPEGHFELIRHMSTPVFNNDQITMIVGVGNKEVPYDDEDVKQLQFIAEEIDKYIARKRAEEELRKVNKLLQEKVKEEVKKSLKQEQLLIQQSKMASMGEMISVITHQWKQPLNTLSMLCDLTDSILKNENFDIDELKEQNKQIKEQILHMNETINDFRNFFKPNNNKSLFTACELAIDVFKLIEAKMYAEGISLFPHAHEHFTCYGYPNEYKQVILNIYSNASDAMAGKDIKEKRIDLFFEKHHDKGIIRIRDNGGGIAEDLLPDKLFEPYVTTKGKVGTGIGLQISKLIVEEKLGGTITAHNVGEGAEFVIELPILHS